MYYEKYLSFFWTNYRCFLKKLSLSFSLAERELKQKCGEFKTDKKLLHKYKRLKKKHTYTSENNLYESNYLQKQTYDFNNNIKIYTHTKTYE